MQPETEIQIIPLQKEAKPMMVNVEQPNGNQWTKERANLARLANLQKAREARAMKLASKVDTPPEPLKEESIQNKVNADTKESESNWMLDIAVGVGVSFLSFLASYTVSAFVAHIINRVERRDDPIPTDHVPIPIPRSETYQSIFK